MEQQELPIEEVYDEKEDLNVFPLTHFDVAKKEYQELIKFLIEEVFIGRVGAEKFFENVNFSPTIGLVDLDIILQYSIVELEYKNGNITDALGLIEGVCKHGSLMQEIRKYDEFFDWSDFNMLSNDESGELLKKLGVYIYKVSRDFVRFLEFYASEDGNKEYIDYIQTKMNNIINVIEGMNKKVIDYDVRSACLTNAIFKQLLKK